MKYIKKILYDSLEFKYLFAYSKLVDDMKVAIILGDTDKDSYNERIEIDRSFRNNEIKGLFRDSSSCDFYFIAYNRLSALLDEEITFVGEDDERHYTKITMYSGQVAEWNSKALGYYISGLKLDDHFGASIAEWLIYYADNTVFYPDSNTVVFRNGSDTVFKYHISDLGLTYLAKARLLT